MDEVINLMTESGASASPSPEPTVNARLPKPGSLCPECHKRKDNCHFINLQAPQGLVKKCVACRTVHRVSVMAAACLTDSSGAEAFNAKVNQYETKALQSWQKSAGRVGYRVSAEALADLRRVIQNETTRQISRRIKARPAAVSTPPAASPEVEEDEYIDGSEVFDGLRDELSELERKFDNAHGEMSNAVYAALLTKIEQAVSHHFGDMWSLIDKQITQHRDFDDEQLKLRKEHEEQLVKLHKQHEEQLLKLRQNYDDELLLRVADLTQSP